MVDLLPVLIVVWAVLTGLFLALLAYNGTLTRYEDDQLFLNEATTNVAQQERQSKIVSRVNKTMPVVRTLGIISAVLAILIVGIYTWDSWLRIRL